MINLTIGDTDAHRLWVVALKMTAAEIAGLSAAANPPQALPDPVAALLGVDTLDRDFVEIFDTADLTGLGLTGYLMTGNAIPEAQLAPDRAKLDTRQGPVLILFASALPNRPVTLHPDPRLTLIGSYADDEPPIHFEPLPEAAAHGSLTRPAQKYSNARMSGMVATIALLVMFALVGLLIWLA